MNIILLFCLFFEVDGEEATQSENFFIDKNFFFYILG